MKAGSDSCFLFMYDMGDDFDYAIGLVGPSNIFFPRQVLNCCVVHTPPGGFWIITGTGASMSAFTFNNYVQYNTANITS